MSSGKSRYADSTSFHVVDGKDRTVSVLPPAPRGAEGVLGYHRRVEAERLDHLAVRYLDDATGFWRIADLNEAILPDALVEVLEIAIPGGKS